MFIIGTDLWGGVEVSFQSGIISALYLQPSIIFTIIPGFMGDA